MIVITLSEIEVSFVLEILNSFGFTNLHTVEWNLSYRITVVKHAERLYLMPSNYEIFYLQSSSACVTRDQIPSGQWDSRSNRSTGQAAARDQLHGGRVHVAGKHQCGGEDLQGVPRVCHAATSSRASHQQLWAAHQGWQEPGEAIRCYHHDITYEYTLYYERVKPLCGEGVLAPYMTIPI